MTEKTKKSAPKDTPSPKEDEKRPVEFAPKRATEIGGPKGLEPTRYGDWERKGICSDF